MRDRADLSTKPKPEDVSDPLCTCFRSFPTRKVKNILKEVNMYTRLYNFPKASETEKQRLIEINFYMVVFKLLQKYKNAIKVVEILEALSQAFECNTQIISQLILNSLNKDPNFAPRHRELILLLYKCEMPLRTISRATGLSNGKIYENIQRYMKQPFEITQKTTQKQAEELNKFMDNIHKIAGIFETWR